MSHNMTVEYISNELDSLYTTECLYVPSIGKRVWIDEKPFEVTAIEPYLYKENCKQNKVRVYLEPLKEE